MEAGTTDGVGTYDPDTDGEPVDDTEELEEAELELGGTIAEAAEAEPDEDEDEGPEPIEGTVAQLTLLVGGEEPTKSTVKIRGGSREVDGEFRKGDTVQLVVTARISEVHLVDRVDDAGYVVSVERRHIAHLDSIRIAQ